MYVNHFQNYKFEALLEGYGDHSMEEIKFYVFTLCMWLMASYIETGRFRVMLRRY